MEISSFFYCSLGRLRPLWPAIGIVVEIILLVIAVSVGEVIETKRKKKKLQKRKLEQEQSMRGQ